MPEFGKRKRPENLTPAPSKPEVTPRGPKAAPESLLHLADTYQSDNPELGDNLRHLAELIAYQNTGERSLDDTKIIDELIQKINSVLFRLEGRSIRRQDLFLAAE